MMDKWITRDFAKRMLEETGRLIAKTKDNICPLCLLINGVSIPQTKEHIMKGICKGTEDLRKVRNNLWCDKLKKWGMNNKEGEQLMNILTQEERELNMAQHTLQSHGKAACLVGMWNNKTILEGREYMVLQLRCNAEQARLRIMQLMIITQEIALIMEERVRAHYTYWMEDLTTEEIQIMNNSMVANKSEEAWSERLKTIKSGEWMIKKKESDEFETWEARAVIRDEAKRVIWSITKDCGRFVN